MALTIGGGNDQWTSIAVSTEQADEGPGNFSVGGHKIYWWRGASTGHATPLPSKISEREAMTITNSTTPTTIHSYSPTDGQSFTGAWRVLAKQTAGTGSPKYAVWRFDTSAYRSGSSLIDIDALVSIAGSANPVGPVCVMVKSGAAYEVRATGELSKTWVFTIVAETIDTGVN
jgi:hypothetical protein